MNLCWKTVFFAASIAAAAQAAPPVSVPGPSSGFSDLIEQGKALAKASDINGAEKLLTAGALAPAGTAEWHLEANQKLAQLAMSLAAEGHNEAAINKLVTQSLTHLDQAGKLAKDVHTQAGAKAAAAYLLLRYQGDPASALEYYQAAAKLDPNDPAIQQALTRLASADAKLRARIHPPKGSKP